MNQTLQGAAGKAGKHGLVLVMENEPTCNTRTIEDVLGTLGGVPSPHFKLCWDPGNSFFAGETPYPDAYARIPRDRIGHVHCKDATRKADADPEWECMGKGAIDFVGQFRALVADGYRGFVVLETHWRGGGGPEESTRASMTGMKAQLAEAGAA